MAKGSNLVLVTFFISYPPWMGFWTVNGDSHGIGGGYSYRLVF